MALHSTDGQRQRAWGGWEPVVNTDGELTRWVVPDF